MARTRSAVSQLGHLLESSPCPVFVLDERRRIVFCNTACAEWLGRSAEQLLGLRCDYCATESPGTTPDVATAICPPPEVFHGRPCSHRLRATTAAGKTGVRRGQFLPLGSSAVEVHGVLAVLSATDEPAGEDSESQQPQGPSGDDDLHDRLRRLNNELRAPYRLERLAGDSPAMRRVREQVHLAVMGGGRAVIVGPPGSGREHVARTIHGGPSPEAAGPLLPLSGGILDPELLQTTVFAFLRRCAATAPSVRPTLLLLDIDELPAESQAELLAFFRIPTFRARTLVTSRRSLLELAEAGGFSRELALALSTLVIELPSLADRRQDIPLLAQQLIEEFNARGGRQFQGLSPAALDAIAPLPWTGNVRELAEVLHEACERAAGPWISADDLPQGVRMVAMAVAHPPRETETIVLDEFLAEIERELIQRALRQARGNKAQAARLLGLPRPRLLRKLTQFGLEDWQRG